MKAIIFHFSTELHFTFVQITSSSW
uniref:Uncharacterized protein n=1 Tax=Anguilla anguilla TaxID=7936 RepID=A0A0E9VED9_ANGAN